MIPLTRVALVEDDDVLRTSLSEAVSAVSGLHLIGAARTLREAFALVDEKPQVFLIDLSLPDGLGVELIRALRAASSPCKTVVISVFGDVENVVEAIEAGADGYLLKGAELSEVADAIQIVMKGGSPLSPAVATHILHRVRGGKRPARQQQNISLTPRETEILQGLAKGLTFKELAKLHAVSPFTIGDHVKSIYRKLEVNSRGEAIFEAAHSGLIRF